MSAVSKAEVRDEISAVARCAEEVGADKGGAEGGGSDAWASTRGTGGYASGGPAAAVWETAAGDEVAVVIVVVVGGCNRLVAVSSASVGAASFCCEGAAPVGAWECERSDA